MPRASAAIFRQKFDWQPSGGPHTAIGPGPTRGTTGHPGQPSHYCSLTALTHSHRQTLGPTAVNYGCCCHTHHEDDITTGPACDYYVIIYNKCTKHQFIHLLTATFKDLHIENSKNYKRCYCLHHTDCVSMCCWIISPFVIFAVFDVQVLKCCR